MNNQQIKSNFLEWFNTIPAIQDNGLKIEECAEFIQAIWIRQWAKQNHIKPTKVREALGLSVRLRK